MVQQAKLQIAYAVVRAAPRHLRDGYGFLGRCRSAGAVVTVTPRLVVTARLRWRAFVAEELGAAMGASTQSAMSLMADALDLRHRLPRLWALVEDLAPWRRGSPGGSRPTPARSPSRAPGGWTSSSPRGSTGSGCPTIQRLVALAAARFAPEEQAEKEAGARVRAPRDPVPPAPRCVRRHLLARRHRRHRRPHRVLRGSSAKSPNSSAGWVTPTTTRPARPTPSASSPADKPPSTSLTTRPTQAPCRGDPCARTSTCTSRWPTSPPAPTALQSSGRWRSSAPPPPT